MYNNLYIIYFTIKIHKKVKVEMSCLSYYSNMACTQRAKNTVKQN